MNIADIADRAIGYGIPGIIADGTDALEMYRVAAAAVKRARAGEGPTLIEAKTHRSGGHAEGEEAFLAGQQYRSGDELAQARAKDPLHLLHTHVTENDLVPADRLESLDESISVRPCKTPSTSPVRARCRQVDSIYEDLWV